MLRGNFVSGARLFSNAFGLAMGDGVDAEGAAAVLSKEQMDRIRSGQLR